MNECNRWHFEDLKASTTVDITTPAYIIGINGSMDNGDLPGIAIVCSECGQVVYAGTIAPGAEMTLEIPQCCPNCREGGENGE